MPLTPGQDAPAFTVDSITGGTLSLANFIGRPLLLMFHRYAGCPMCNIRLHRFHQEYPALEKRGLKAVAFFHSSAAEIRKHAGGRQYSFAIATDPKFRVYRKYGVVTSWPRLLGSMLLPSAYREMAAAMRQGFRGGRPTRRLATMPADFFIRPDGRVHAAHYGNSIADHMSHGQIEAALGETIGNRQ